MFFFLLVLGALGFMATIRYRNSKLQLRAHSQKPNRPLRVVFLHPDLGLGGAERLVVDAAVGLQQLQKKIPVSVTMVTNYHNPKRAFAETTSGDLEVVVRGSWIPRHVKNKGHVLFATLRMMYAALVTAALEPEVDVYFVDQVSATMIVLKLLVPRSRILFYCHFPDQLCDPTRMAQAAGRPRSLLRRLYRSLFDKIEAATMELADSIVCNSQFSRGVTVKTFPRLQSRISETEDIFYPPINVAAVVSDPAEKQQKDAAGSTSNPFQNPTDAELEGLLMAAPSFVSLNRYEEKKNIQLALEAFALVIKMFKSAAASTPCPVLFIAGGYDPRLPENVEVHVKLIECAKALGVLANVHFLRSISERQKYLLLKHCRCVVYTPSGEHFGIVPIEAMAHAKIVVAVSDGGPLESVGTGDEFGFLRPPIPQEFASAMFKALVMPSKEAEQLGQAARGRCERLFSLASFSRNLAARMIDLSSRAK